MTINTFDRHVSTKIGTVATKVGGFTVGAGVVTAIGLSVSNVSTNAIKVSVSLFDGVNDYFIVKNADMVPGGAVSLIGGDQKIVMKPGDSIRIVSNGASSVDAILSILTMV